MKPRVKTQKIKSKVAAPSDWDLRLYVAGASSKSIATFRNLENLCEEHLAGRYRIEVIDLMKTPQLAQGHQILAMPAVVRRLPAPIRKVVGNLSNSERVLVGLDLRCHKDGDFTRRDGATHVEKK